VYYTVVIADNRLLSLDETTAEVARLLAERGLAGGGPDGRVSAVPDARTIRYYTSLGLLDRPRIEGRVARYGRRHVLQILAIKALQADGLPLGEVQAHLYGRSDRELDAIVASVQPRVGPTVQEVRPVTWREVTIEPGLKIMAEPGWRLPADPTILSERISAAINALHRDSGGPAR
jgi:DNA-binding transcriptional MerR regulator